MEHRSDTHPEAAKVQLDLLRRASVARRIELAAHLSADVIRLSRRALATRHPELSHQEVLLRWAELHYGPDLVGRVRRLLEARQG